MFARVYRCPARGSVSRRRSLGDTDERFRQPIVVDPDGVIVCGHTRWRAAKKLALDRVPVHVARDLTPEQVRAYRIADNKTAQLATWHMRALTEELQGLGQELDWTLLGFDADELQKLLGGEMRAGLTGPDDTPAPPDEAITQPGDLWVLCDHRLLCGDSGSSADLDRLLGGQPIHLVNTDPWYNGKVEPRSNNAIAAGNSSFPKAKRTHHQSFDVARQGQRHQAQSAPSTDVGFVRHAANAHPWSHFDRGYHCVMPGLFDGTSLERPVTCERCHQPLTQCKCPRAADGRVLPPKDQPARVNRERRAGGKVVTIITGLDACATDLPAMLKQFKAQLGAGGTISDGRVELQGDHREKMVEILRQMGYPAKASGG